MKKVPDKTCARAHVQPISLNLIMSFGFMPEYLREGWLPVIAAVAAGAVTLRLLGSRISIRRAIVAMLDLYRRWLDPLPVFSCC